MPGAGTIGRVKHSRLLAAGGVSLLAATAAVSCVVAPSGAVTAKAPAVPVTHVIEIMIENHSFDNLFGKFPGADGIPADTSLLNPDAYFDSAPNVQPVWAAGNEGDVNGEINNSTVAEQMAMDYQPGQGYLMDHYTVFPQDGMAAITEFGPQFDPDEQYLASAYELADHNFQPVIAPTQPNVMTALNGTDHGWVYNNLAARPDPAVELHFRRADRARPQLEDLLRAAAVRPGRDDLAAAHPARARRGPDHRIGVLRRSGVRRPA